LLKQGDLLLCGANGISASNEAAARMSGREESIGVFRGAAES